MMKLLTICLGFALYACSMADKGHDLIIKDIDAHTSTTTTEKPHKFLNLKTSSNPQDFKDALGLENTALNSLKDQIAEINKKRRINAPKHVTKKHLDDLKAIKPLLEIIKHNLQKINEISLERQHHIGHNQFTMIREMVVNQQREALHAFNHIVQLIDLFNCKFMKKCFDDDLETAKGTELAGFIKKLANIEKDCHTFTKSCADRYKKLREDLEKFKEERIGALKTQFGAIIDNDCIKLEATREQLSKHILELTAETNGRISKIQYELKKLVEKKLKSLSLSFQDNCDHLNELKISAKDNEDNIPALQAIIVEMKHLLQKSEQNTIAFLDVYELLLHLQDVLDSKVFSDCYDTASSLYYLITGFKMQIEECISDEVEKRIKVVAFETELKAKQNHFGNLTADFEAELRVLKKLPQASTCGEINTLESRFAYFKNGAVDYPGLDACKLTVAALQLRLEAELKDCPEHAAFKAVLDKLEHDVKHYCENNEHQLCFAELYRINFCS